MRSQFNPETRNACGSAALLLISIHLPNFLLARAISLSVVRVTLLRAAPAVAPVLPPLSVPAIAHRAAELQHQRREEMSSIGVGVAPEGQKLFDTLRRSMKCEWSADGSFLVLGAVRVAPPYTSAACSSVTAAAPAQSAAAPTSPNSGGRRGAGAAAAAQAQAAQAAAAEVTLNRVRKIVDAERVKLKLNAAS
jgi:hypothetical protein